MKKKNEADEIILSYLPNTLQDVAAKCLIAQRRLAFSKGVAVVSLINLALVLIILIGRCFL